MWPFAPTRLWLVSLPAVTTQPRMLRAVVMAMSKAKGNSYKMAVVEALGSTVAEIFGVSRVTKQLARVVLTPPPPY